jgi:hypothetical protein
MDRDTAEAMSAVIRASLAHGRASGHGGRHLRHTADNWPRGKGKWTHGKLSEHGRDCMRHTADNWPRHTFENVGATTLGSRQNVGAKILPWGQGFAVCINTIVLYHMLFYPFL